MKIGEKYSEHSNREKLIFRGGGGGHFKIGAPSIIFGIFRRTKRIIPIYYPKLRPGKYPNSKQSRGRFDRKDTQVQQRSCQ